MSDLTILSQMIRNNAKVELTKNYGKTQVILTEPQCQSSFVTIFGLPSDVVILKSDMFKSPDSIFCGSKGECKRADYIVVANASNKKVILFIELKKEKGIAREIEQQMNGALCFILYCKEIGRKFWGKKNFLDDFNYRFISIGHTSIPKKKTRFVRQSNFHDCPERMMKIDWPHNLQFNHLVGSC